VKSKEIIWYYKLYILDFFEFDFSILSFIINFLKTVNNNIESESNSTSIEHLNKNKHQNDSIKYIDSNNAIEIATD
jgi:hypothetical protein